jgi:hypothetical protein
MSDAAGTRRPPLLTVNRAPLLTAYLVPPQAAGARPACTSGKAPFRLGEALQGQLPVSNVNPSTKLESDLRELSNLDKTEFLMQGDAGDVGQGNTADGDMQTRSLEMR